MNLQGFKTLAGLLALLNFAAACGQPPDKAEAMRSVEKSNNQNGTGDGTGSGTNPDGSPAPAAPGPNGTASTQPTAAQLNKSLEFFNNQVLPLTRVAPCIDCHSAPRNLKDPTVNGGEGIKQHNPMLALLKDGKGPNDNKLINKLLNIIPHKGGKVCADEGAQPCGKVKEWYRAVFGEGTLSLGKIESINREGVINGWAGTVEAPTTSYEIKLFLDGPKGTGTALPSVTANLESYDNGLTGPHGFSLKVPEAMIDGKEHKIHAYAVHNGQDVELGGSPFTYTAFKPKTAAVATAFAQINFNGCNGACHNFVYENRWGTMLGNGANGTWTATSNSLYDKLSGSLGHGGPALPGGINLNAVQTWWTQEFGP